MQNSTRCVSIIIDIFAYKRTCTGISFITGSFGQSMLPTYLNRLSVNDLSFTGTCCPYSVSVSIIVNTSGNFRLSITCQTRIFLIYTTPYVNANPGNRLGHARKEEIGTATSFHLVCIPQFIDTIEANRFTFCIFYCRHFI